MTKVGHSLFKKSDSYTKQRQQSGKRPSPRGIGVSMEDPFAQPGVKQWASFREPSTKNSIQTTGPVRSAGSWLSLIALIAINVTTVILETVDSIEARFHMTFWVIEIVSVAVFSVEYAARVWASPDDWAF